MNRISEWERVARYEAAMPHVYQVIGMWKAGSAWVWDHDTFITNMHVVEGMVGFESNVTVRRDNREWQAVKIIPLHGVDAAMIDVQGIPLIPAKRSSRFIRSGEYILVGGYPYRFGPIMTEGHISGIYKRKDRWQYSYYADVAVNPGNSGGPIFSKSGKIVGMTAAVTTPPGRSMALLIPLQRIIDGMERPEFSEPNCPVGRKR
ncbi:MAG: trypsin-like peptidase domain-containing protein [Candidatus Thorarchaeota archaeon]|jgi:serine protease Do